MGKRIMERMLHYRVPLMVTIMVILLLVNHYAHDYWIYYQPTRYADELLGVTKLLSILLWTAVMCCTILIVRYRDLCNRNMLMDRYVYRRTIPELFRYFRDADPHRMDIRKLPVLDWQDASGVILGKVGKRLVYRDTSEGNFDGANFALFALPGGGKTTSQIIPSAMRFLGSVLAIDIKGDIYNAVKHLRRIKIFAPDNPTISCTFDPFYGITKMSVTEVKVLIEQIAAVLVPEDKNGRYFVEGGRDCFCGISLFMLSNNIRTTFPEIIRAILSRDAVSWITEIYQSSCTIAQEYTNSYYGTSEINVSGAYGEMRKHIRTLCTDELMQLLIPSDNCISPQMLDNGYDIFIELPQHKVDFYSPITTILVQRFMTSFMQRSDKSSGERLRPVLFLLDEFPQLQFDFKTLSAALSTLRSKSVSIFMAQQSISQLINRYGESAQREIIDTCQYISIMSVQDPKSRQFFQELIGERKTLKSTTGDSDAEIKSSIGARKSHGAQETTEPIFKQGDFANLGDNVIVYAKGRYVLAEKTYFFK